MSPATKISTLKFPEVRVVEASAGSGKTYALAKRYLQLLLNPQAGSEDIRNILAITFTNKAAREMKERILEFLKRIALNDWPNRKLQEDILGSLPVSKAAAGRLAGRLLDYIIHNYNFFQVQTIDSFVNLILNGCAFSLRLSANFQIKDNIEDFLTYSIDEYIDLAGKGEARRDLRKQLDEFLIQYIYLENKTGWLPRQDMLKLLKTLFTQISLYGGPLKSFPLTVDLRREKHKIMASFRKIQEKLPEEANKTFRKTLVSFLENNKDSFDFAAFKQKTSLVRAHIPLLKNSIIPKKLDRSWQELQEKITETAGLEAFSLFNCYIDIFSFVYRFFRQFARREDVLFLSELNQQAQTLIDEHGVTVPELYYRLATRYRHYLIDEFQDTSLLQWQNILPMVEDTLSAGGSLFYVGDKKQAIYRFRGGDVSLFDRVKEDFAAFNIRPESLRTNHRSHEQIVLFNNAVFSAENLSNFIQAQQENPKNELKLFSPEETAEILAVFKNSRQELPENKQGGYVLAEEVLCRDTEEKKEQLKLRLIPLLRELQTRFAPGDIAILCRDNKDLELVSGWLIDEKIPVESEKTLNIRNNRYIKEVISLLGFLSSPIDNLSFASFLLGDIFSAATGIKKEQLENFLLDCRPHTGRDKNFYIYQEFRRLYPRIWESYLEGFFKNAGLLGLYELLAGIFTEFKLLVNFPHHHGFFARLLEIVREKEDEYAGIADFLAYFREARPDDLYVDFSSAEAIKVMSIHKAKGLGFGVVVVPFLELNINDLGPGGRKSDVSFTVMPANNGLALIRLDSKYALLSPPVAAAYREEYRKAFIDELNSVYVALTRAREELYLFIPHGMSKSKNIVPLLVPEDLRLRGNRSAQKPPAEKGAATCTLATSAYTNWLSFLKNEFGDLSALKNRGKILRGKVLHFLLSAVDNLRDQDIDEIMTLAAARAAREFPARGSFSEYKTIIKRVVSHSDTRKFFYLDDGLVCREKEVVDSRGCLRRIDRLIVKEHEAWVIDYKSRFEKTADYRRQILEYMAIIKEIYPLKRVKGFLIYLEDAKTEEIL